MDRPVGISSVWPGSRTVSCLSMARRSRPAEPGVAYCGRGNSAPRRGSRILACRECIGFSVSFQAVGDEGDQLAGDLALAGLGEGSFVQFAVDHGDRVL